MHKRRVFCTISASLWKELGLFRKAGSESKADRQVVLVHSMDHLKKARKGIPDILLWVEAFWHIGGYIGFEPGASETYDVIHAMGDCAAHVNGSHWQDFDWELHPKAAAMGNWKWSTHGGDLLNWSCVKEAKGEILIFFCTLVISRGREDHVARECLVHTTRRSWKICN